MLLAGHTEWLKCKHTTDKYVWFLVRGREPGRQIRVVTGGPRHGRCAAAVGSNQSRSSTQFISSDAAQHCAGVPRQRRNFGCFAVSHTHHAPASLV